MNSHYEDLIIDDIQLDMDNPRIAKWIEMYDKKTLNSEQIAMALGSGVEEPSSGQTNYASLYNSIKTNRGIIHPIIVNHQKNGDYVVIEGNTRVQIYKEFKENGVEGNWDTIPSIVYEDLSDSQIHAIRLQSHLVGPREWDPYSKARYLNYLSNEENLPMNTVIDFCGGKSSEVNRFINAYKDMEKYYRPLLESDDEFDPREFSKFYELQNSNIKQLLLSKFSMNDFAQWVIDGNVDTAINVRKLPQILKSEEATKTLLSSNIKEAYEKVITDRPEHKDLKSVSIEQLCSELINRINNLRAPDIRKMQDEESELRTTFSDLKEWCDWIVEGLN